MTEQDRRKERSEVHPEQRLEDVKAAAQNALERFDKMTKEVTQAFRELVDKEHAA
jgi:hypothetical protein